jgi:hypothetical protein
MDTVRRGGWMRWLGLGVGCGVWTVGGCATDGSDGSPVIAAEARAGTEGKPAAGNTTKVTELAPIAPNPSEYGGKVLVMLSAKVERGHQPEGLGKAAGLANTNLVRLDSSEFSGLMPCYELVVAGAFADTKGAKALASALKAVGVDSAIKPAGRHVGQRPELEAVCGAMANPPAPSERVAFRGAGGFVLPVAEELSERAREGRTALKAGSTDYSVWTSPLPANNIGRFSVGQTWSGADYEKGNVSCTLTGFLAGTEGTPHFGVLQQETPPKEPTCGAEEIWASADCKADLLFFGEAPAEVGVWEGEPTELKGRPNLPPSWKQAVDDTIEKMKKDAPNPVSRFNERWVQRKLKLDGSEALFLQVEITTGEGNWYCGGEDQRVDLAGVALSGNQAAGPLQVTTGEAVRGVFRWTKNGAPVLHLVEELSQSPRLSDDSAKRSIQYCDCPC